MFTSKALKFFRLDKYINDIIRVIILDSIISNSDRHQENWGIITEYNDVVKELEKIAKSDNKKLGAKILFNLLAITSLSKRHEIEKVIGNINLLMPGRFSQIYDSGSCLGRELSDQKVHQMLTDTNMLEAYIKRGKAEIRWENQYLNHFELIEKIHQDYSYTVIDIVQEMKKSYNLNEVGRIVNNIDEKLPNELIKYNLPSERKEFVIKLITLRYNKVIELIK